MLKNRSDQSDVGLGFNGQSNGSSQRASAPKIMVNQYTGYMNDGRDVQKAQMPNRKGNSDGDMAGPNSAKGGKIDGGRAFAPSAGQNYKGNPDQIQMKQMPNRTGNMC